MPRQALKQRHDGRYRCKYKGLEFYGKTAQEALDARREYIRTEGSRVKEMTVGRYAAEWLPVHRASVIDKTYNDYAKQINVLIDMIGNVPIGRATVTDIKKVYNHFIGYSSSTIHRAKMLYTSMWNCAIEEGYARINPCKSELAKPHKGTAGTHRALTEEEDRLLLEVDSPFRLPALVMRYAGLRRGEVLALDVDRDVDFERKVIHVRKAVRYDSNQPILADPKTDAGVRDVPLLRILEDELKGHHGLVALSAAGKQMSERAFKSAWSSLITAMELQANGISRRWYGRTRKQRKLAAEDRLPAWKSCAIRAHDLRHSYCTMLRDSGVDMKIAMRWMGHADEKMIIRIYDHVSEKRLESAVKSLEEMAQGVKTRGSADEKS